MNVQDIVGATTRAGGRPGGISRSKQIFFGPAHTVGGTTVIPVAESRLRLAFGGDGRGAGGVGALRIEPTGFITVRGERADFTPIRDTTRLILLGIVGAMVLLSVGASLAARRGRASGESSVARRG